MNTQALFPMVCAVGPFPSQQEQASIIDAAAVMYPDAVMFCAALRACAFVTESDDLRKYLREAADYADPALAADDGEDYSF